jgi:hypothetical protein
VTSWSDRYPKAAAAIAALSSARATTRSLPTAFTVGPGIMRAPPRVQRAPVSTPPSRNPDEDDDDGAATGTDELLGELVDMVLVGADETGGAPEVHLVFKASVLGGVHLRLVKEPEGLRASFLVDDSAGRRAIAAHADDLVARLRDRGFAVTGHDIALRGERGP